MREDKSPCKCYGRKHESLAYNWLLGRAMMLGSFITVSGRLIILGYSRTGTCLLCLHFFLSSTCILSSFVFSFSPRTRLDLTTMLSTGPLIRL